MLRELYLQRMDLISETLKGCFHGFIILVNFLAIGSYLEPFSSFQWLSKKSKFTAKSLINPGSSDIIDKDFAQTKDNFATELTRSNSDKASPESLSTITGNSLSAIMTFTRENFDDVEETLSRPHLFAWLPLRSPPL